MARMEYEPWESGAVASDGQRQASHTHGHSPVPGTRERIPLDRVFSRSIWVFFSPSLSGHLPPAPGSPAMVPYNTASLPLARGTRDGEPIVQVHHCVGSPLIYPPARVRSEWRTERAQLALPLIYVNFTCSFRVHPGIYLPLSRQ